MIDHRCMSFVVLLSTCVDTVLVFYVRNCVKLLICVVGRVAGLPSTVQDQQRHKKLVHFFL